MSVNVNIDKASLVDAIAADVCARCGTAGGLSDLDMLSIMHNRHRLDIGAQAYQDLTYAYVGGWHFFKYTGSAYPAVWLHDWFPWVGQWPTDIRIELGAIMQVRSIGTDMYVLFFERVRTEAYQTYLGYKINSNGTVTLYSYPANQSATVGTISMGDIIELDIVLLYDSTNQKWQAHGTLRRYDWDNDEWTDVGRATVDIADPDVPYKYIALFEANASSFEVATAVAHIRPIPIPATGDPTYPTDFRIGIFNIMRQKGLVDPRTVAI